MTDFRRSLVIWGGSASVLGTVAILGATSLTGTGNGALVRVLGITIATIALFLCVYCIYRMTVVANRLTQRALASQLRTQSEDLKAVLSKRTEDVLAIIERVDLESKTSTNSIAAELVSVRNSFEAFTARCDESIAASSSIARMQQLQTEQIATIRKQSRACLDHLRASGSEVPLKSPNGEPDNGSLEKLRSEMSELGAQVANVETGQRRIMNYLRKESNMQVVLDRVQASERRLLSSFEAGALTLVDELGETVANGESRGGGER